MHDAVMDLASSSSRTKGFLEGTQTINLTLVTFSLVAIDIGFGYGSMDPGSEVEIQECDPRPASTAMLSTHKFKRDSCIERITGT